MIESCVRPERHLCHRGSLIVKGWRRWWPGAASMIRSGDEIGYLNVAVETVEEPDEVFGTCVSCCRRRDCLVPYARSHRCCGCHTARRPNFRSSYPRLLVGGCRRRGLCVQ